jgi:hypothetical protein
VKGVEADQKSMNSAGIDSSSPPGAVKASVAVSTPITADQNLQLIHDTWPRLPHAIRAAIVAMVRTTIDPPSGL